jgi:hypothetical protein
MTLNHDVSKRQCHFCGASFRPRHPSQRYCRYWCSLNGKSAEGRAARRVWWRAGRPSETEVENGEARKEAR